MRDLLPSIHDRLLYACAHATGSIPSCREPLASVPLEDPNALRAALSLAVGEERTVVVTKPLDRRLVLIQRPYLDVGQIRGVGFRRTAQTRTVLPISLPYRTAIVANRSQEDMWPELDLLDRTFAHRGVAQLESSRGCTNYCSFCPRGHKGQWSGARPDALPWLLRQMGAVFDRHPDLNRTIYLVDEEFIGRGDDAATRAMQVADTLAQAGFTWETSCRVDQVARPDRDRAWHLERGHLWRGLVERILRRCLFGVESGVTSVLERFNKETTGEQNALAIRTLTALGVPPRFTYITFDQLMTAAELRQTYAFRGRTDLLLQPQAGLSVTEIIDGVHDERWVAARTTGRPFYTGISYLLVGMECLIGAAYTRRAEAAGLTGRADPSMGRVEARYADWRVGVLAHRSQLWIDRNFALDYTLKSLEKILTGQPYAMVRDLRRLLKDAADALLIQLRSDLEPVVATVATALPDDRRDILRHEHRRWAAPRDWQLINAADPCGT